MRGLVNWRLSELSYAPMRLITIAIAALTLVCAATISAQPRLTFDYPAIARRIVQQLALKPGERVLSVAHPGLFDELVPHLRYEVMRAGGIDLGVVEVLREPWPESFELPVLIRGDANRAATTRRCSAASTRRS
jgi:hypothetical protein